MSKYYSLNYWEHELVLRLLVYTVSGIVHALACLPEYIIRVDRDPNNVALFDEPRRILEVILECAQKKRLVRTVCRDGRRNARDGDGARRGDGGLSGAKGTRAEAHLTP